MTRITSLAGLILCLSVSSFSSAEQSATAEIVRPDDLELSGRQEARRAVEMVRQQKYREALDLLSDLRDDDFIVPPHWEISSIREDGTVTHERIEPPPIGNRGLLMAECCMELGKQVRAMNLLWRLLAENCLDPEVYTLFTRVVDGENGESVLERLRSMHDEHPRNWAVPLAIRYVQVDLGLEQGNLDFAIEAIRSGPYLRETDRYREGDLKEWVCRRLSATPDRSVPRLIDALAVNDQPTWIIYCLGLCGDPRAIEPLERCRERIQNTWVRIEIDEAIGRINKGKPVEPKP